MDLSLTTRNFESILTDIYQKHNSQQDYFTRDRFEEKEGWAPSMYLREVASSQYNARQKGKHAAVRAMLRDTRLTSISVLAGKKNRIPTRVDSLKSQFSGPSVHPHILLLNFFVPIWLFTKSFCFLSSRKKTNMGPTSQEKECGTSFFFDTF